MGGVVHRNASLWRVYIAALSVFALQAQYRRVRLNTSRVVRLIIQSHRRALRASVHKPSARGALCDEMFRHEPALQLVGPH